MKLPLADKRLIQPEPKLNAPLQSLSEVIAAWPNIISATHWHCMRPAEIDGADFYVEAEASPREDAAIFYHTYRR